MAVYLDCNATTPVDPQVIEIITKYLRDEYGNAGSRTHEFGARAARAVELAREQVAQVVGCAAEEVNFTSGATESNNIAILGIEAAARSRARMHIVSTSIEHKAVLEPLERLGTRGFDVTYVAPVDGGRVAAEEIIEAVRGHTSLVSVMHINNETGVIQPIGQIAEALCASDVLFHVDAAQGFGKELNQLAHPRIDLISISGHKIYGPKGVGALITRRRNYRRPPLEPLMVGGGQERGLRPGTLPVALIAGLGLAAHLLASRNDAWRTRCENFQAEATKALGSIGARFNGDQLATLPNVISFSVPGVSSEAAIVALRNLAAVSNGSACTSHSYQPSHVLKAMRLNDDDLRGAIRMSWCHMTPKVDWSAIIAQLKALM